MAKHLSTLHIVIPVFNEPGTLEPCLRRVLAAPLPEGWHRRIVLVDDCSDAAHARALDLLLDHLRGRGAALDFHRHARNRGKGAALQTGFNAVLAGASVGGGEVAGEVGGEVGGADLVIIQDADLEYDPNDFARLMEPLMSDTARSQRPDAVIGTRWGPHRALPGVKRRIHALGNQFLTLLSNAMTGYRLHDMECCYKLMPVALLRRVRPMLTEERFGIEPQIVAALARLNARVLEVPISYDPRGLAAGKKIGWRDGVRALIVIARERLRHPRLLDCS